MTKYARSVNGIVQEVFIPPSGLSISDCFTPEVVAMFHACPDEVQSGWSWDQASDTYSPPADGVATTNAGNGNPPPPEK